MRWKTGRRSSNIEDRRGRRTVGGTVFKGGAGAIVLTLTIAYFLGIDPQVLLQLQQDFTQPSIESDYQPTLRETQLVDLVSVVLADTEDTWHAIFR
jgi:predicted metalloprotease